MSGLTIHREVDLSDHTVMFVVVGNTGRTFEVHCDRCGSFEVFETEVDARRHGVFCAACDCQACEGTGTVAAGDYYGSDEGWTGCDADITCPSCNGSGKDPS
jgi:hypothetical protein